MNEKMGVVSPEGLQLRLSSSVSRHLDTLEGKTIGEVYNNPFKGEQMFRAYRRLLKQKYPGVINIVVCGDPDRNRAMVLWGGDVSPVTKKSEIVSAGS